VNQLELARPTRARRIAALPHRAAPISVTVAWVTSAPELASGLRPMTLELATEPETGTRTWTCPQGRGSDWLAALCLSGSREIVVTAELGNDTSAKHLVLELAELLTQKLSATQALVRVLFLPRAGHSGNLRRAV
jgi:hypothetical protein